MQDAKEICHLDKGQVTCWNSWHSRSVITLIAYAFLAVTAALERAAERGRNDPTGPASSLSAVTNSSAGYRS